MSARIVHIVDDDEAMLKSADCLLTAAGYVVTAHRSGADFLDRVDVEAANCIILDIDMPEMDGFAVQAAIARRGADVPVIFFTGRHGADVEARAIATGAANFLRKPVNRSTMLDAVADAFDRAEQIRFRRA